MLAAGEARRYGAPKVLERLHGRSLLDHALTALDRGGCAPVVVVLGAHADMVRRAVRLPVTVHNPAWSSGMGSSFRTGLAALPPQADGVVVALADQPLVGAEVVSRLLRVARTGADAAVASYAGRPRNPVFLARRVFAEVVALAQGDRGARDWLRANPDRVVSVPCDGVGDPSDVDTPADLARLAANARSRASERGIDDEMGVDPATSGED